jgi:uncharacterized protein DUF6588
LKVKIIKILCVICVFSVNLSAQDLKDKVTQLFSDKDFTEYLTPLSKAFGASLGSSYSFNAKTHKFPHFDLGINYLTVPIKKGEKYFDGDSARSATVFGPANNLRSQTRGLNLDVFEIPVLQLSLGIGDNTNLLLRYSDWKSKKLGKIKVYGAGVKYELENLFSISPIPFSIGVLAIYQKYKIDDYIEGAVFGMNLIVSKELHFLPIEIYGGVGYINNITNIDNPQGTEDISISIPGLEEVRYHFGANFSIMFFRISAETTFGDYKSLSAGLHFSL